MMGATKMQLQDFHYQLPTQLIAQRPLAERSASRMLAVDSNANSITHRRFVDLVDLLNPNDLLVFNNTKVIPARLYAIKSTGGKVEIFIERILADNQVLALLRASKAPKIGSQMQLPGGEVITVTAKQPDFYRLAFPAHVNIHDILNKYGEVPLPPYINREVEAADNDRYQTIYASEKGAVAAPTAGLHFDAACFERLQTKGIVTAYTTLHVGAGTFQPVRVTDIRQHQMHQESIHVSDSLCKQIHASKKQGGRIIAVGTTTVRSLETAAQSGTVTPFQGDTDIFIYPGYQFKCIDAMVTNLHLPSSTLLMMVCAFGGYELMMQAYHQAVEARYRFFSYGDAMFIS